MLCVGVHCCTLNLYIGGGFNINRWLRAWQWEIINWENLKICLINLAIAKRGVRDTFDGRCSVQEDFFWRFRPGRFFLSKVCPGRVDAGIERGGGYFALYLRNSIKVCFHNVTGCVWILASEDKLVFQTSVKYHCVELLDPWSAKTHCSAWWPVTSVHLVL